MSSHTRLCPTLSRLVLSSLMATGLSGVAAAAVAPTAVDDALTVAPGAETVLNLLGNDTGTGPLSVVATGTPAHGTVVLGNGKLRYKPAAGYTGADSFSYTIRDGVKIGAVVNRGVLGSFAGVPVYASGFGSAIAPVPGSSTDFYIMTDRGPNVGGTGTNKVFPFPSFAPSIARVTPDAATGGYKVVNIIQLKRPAGAPANAFGTNLLTGLPNTFNPTTGVAVAVGGTPLTPGTDDFGFDSEGLVALADGTFWISDEYGPYLAHFAADGTELERIAPSSLPAAAGHGGHTFPAVLKKRFENKGMEGVTVTPDGTKLVGIMQSPLDNLVITAGVSDVKKGVATRLVVYDIATGTTQQYCYLLDRTGSGTPNTTISEISAVSNRKFLIDERDSKFPNDPAGAATVKRIYEIDLDGDPALGAGKIAATDISDAGDALTGKLFTGGKTMEDLTYAVSTTAASAALVAEGVQPVFKRLVVDLLQLGGGYAYNHDKIEGLAVTGTTTDPLYGTVASNIVISNDDDFGVTDASPAADTPGRKGTPQGVADYNEILSIDLTRGGPGITGFADTASATANVNLTVAAATPYLVSTASGVITRPILTVGESVNLKPDGFTPYRMVGIPDGLGLFDNGDGTFTVLMNHEITGGASPKGAVRAHGSAGAFVSRWVINKSTLAVQSIRDQTLDAAHLFTWNGTAYVAGTTVLSRFCSADLAAPSAFLNGTKGTTARLFMQGEEDAAGTRMWAHVASGANEGNTYQLPRLGRFEAENQVANPKAQDKTIVMGQNDNGLSGTGTAQGQVFCYVGTKQVTGTGPLDIDDAGLTNGKLYGIAVTGFALEDRASPFGGLTKGASKPFTLGQLGATGDVSALTSAEVQTAADAAGVTRFLRPEDGAWDPQNPTDYYFVTTDRIDNLKNGGDGTAGTNAGRSRLWRLRFSDIANPENGGTITMLIDGSENPGPQMMDNMAFDAAGRRIVLDEDPGNFVAAAKVWVYSLANGSLTAIAKHDPARFGDRSGSPLANTAATAPFTTDEESSGVVDASAVLGAGWFLTVVQAHYTNPDPELVEGGQLVAVYVPSSVGGGGAGIASSPATSTPYLVATDSRVTIGALATVGDTFNLKPDGMTPYRMVGIPDGLGAFDNGDGTFTVLMNHEITGGATPKGIARAHGSAGAFVSRWTIRKSDFTVLSIQDQIGTVYTWNGTAYVAGTTVFSRFCSADLPAASAFLNGTKGTATRIFMNGEEDAAGTRMWAHLVTGAGNGSSYQLPRLGRYEAENQVACPKAQDKTIVMGQNDNGLSGTGTGQGQVFCYVGTKQTTGTGPLDIDDAGLTNGKLYGIVVTGFALEDRASPFGGLVKGASKPFTLGQFGATGDVSALTSAEVQTAADAANVTRFQRPEDGAWDAKNPADYYFVTTDRIDNLKNGGDGTAGTNAGRSRLWRLRFSDIANPENGGTITLLIDGAEDPGPQMMDNMTVDAAGRRILIDEDPGNFVAAAKIWSYSLVNGSLTAIAKHDPARFGDRSGSPLANTAATAPFTTDEESSGILDVGSILGAGWFLVDVQAHYTNSDSELVEGGQLLAMHVPYSVGAGAPVVAGALPSPSASTPYLVPTSTTTTVGAIATVGESFNLKPDGITPYRMVGIPDGLGAYDNGDGTFTLLMNHEITGGATPKGIARAHGSAGAFVSRWVIDKTTLVVKSIRDQIPDAAHLFTWDGTAYVPGTTTLSRFCSADLAAASAFLNGGKGTAARIFMDGEEDAAGTRMWAHIVSGANDGKSYQLPRLGRYEAENQVANPKAQDKTIVMGQNDNGLSGTGTGQGQVFCYVGTKQTTGTGPLDIDDAGLTNGKLYGVVVTGFALEDRASPFGGLTKGASKAFTLGQLGATGDVSALDAAGVQTAADAANVTRFQRPEDGAWDPTKPTDYYFVTTDRIDNLKNGGDGTAGTNAGRSRLWRLRFTDIANPTAGGTITLLVDGSEDPGPQMMDNLTMDGANGRVLIDEDPGNFVGSAKIWAYTIADGSLTALAKHDPARFGERAGSPLANTAATAPFTTDEESSGVLDVSSILGPNMFLVDVQAHYTNSDPELVEGGQLLVMKVTPKEIAPPAPVSNDDDDKKCGSGSGIAFLGFGLLLGLLGLGRRRKS